MPSRDPTGNGAQLPPRDDRAAQFQYAAKIVLSFVLLGFGIYTLWYFLSALAWAVIFAIALWPLYRRVRARCSGYAPGSLLPALFTVAVALIFIVPLSLVGVQFASDARGAAEWLRSAQQNGIAEPEWLHHLPAFQAPTDAWWQENLADPGAAKELVERVTLGHVVDASRIIATELGRRLVSFAFTLVTLFFLFKEGDAVTEQMRRLACRIFGPSGERIGRQMIVSVRGTVDGLVLVGLGEGVVLGIVYAVAGVPDATVFGSITAVAAIIPFGAPLIFSIAALWLAVRGSIAWGLAVLGAGTVVLFFADHVVRPVLIGGATKLPFIWVLLGILGGLEMWGLIGLFLGPAIMAALILLWREWAGEAAAPAAVEASIPVGAAGAPPTASLAVSAFPKPTAR
jgi:predicted PurR-regulated permease PerM